jgi:hypothetical protein
LRVPQTEFGNEDQIDSDEPGKLSRTRATPPCIARKLSRTRATPPCIARKLSRTRATPSCLARKPPKDVGKPISVCGQPHLGLWATPSRCVGSPISDGGQPHLGVWATPSRYVGKPISVCPNPRSEIDFRPRKSTSDHPGMAKFAHFPPQNPPAPLCIPSVQTVPPCGAPPLFHDPPHPSTAA